MEYFSPKHDLKIDLISPNPFYPYIRRSAISTVAKAYVYCSLTTVDLVHYARVLYVFFCVCICDRNFNEKWDQTVKISILINLVEIRIYFSSHLNNNIRIAVIQFHLFVRKLYIMSKVQSGCCMLYKFWIKCI